MRVPQSAVIGEVGQGMSIALNALNLSRAFISTLAVGIMQRALDEAVAYAKQRKQFGKRLIDFEMVQQMLADMAIKTEAARVLVNNCMRQMDAGEKVRKDGAIVKTFVTDAMQEVVSNAVQVLGGLRLLRGVPGGEAHARRQDLPDLRGIESDPAHDHRQGTRPGVPIS